MARDLKILYNFSLPNGSPSVATCCFCRVLVFFVIAIVLGPAQSIKKHADRGTLANFDLTNECFNALIDVHTVRLWLILPKNIYLRLVTSI